MSTSRRPSLYYSAILLLTVLLASCVNTRKATYFNDVADTSVSPAITIPESFIQKNDLLAITVSSPNPEATAIYNLPTPVNASQPTGYLVNSDGYLLFPGLGSIKAEGLTKSQLKANITQALTEKKLLVDPIVSIRWQNFKVTVLGEVANPTVVPVPSEKITLLEALGFAGDVTIYGRRDNILVIREENGVKTTRRLNLNTGEIFTSPYYYLKSNDIVYVEPNKSKVASASRTNQWLPVILGALSLGVILIDRVGR